LPLIRGDGPDVRGLVVHGRFHPRVELDVLPHAETVGDVPEVSERLGLGREPLRPVPLVLELLREGVRVDPALAVGSRARIAVPVPSAAHVRSRLDDLYREAELAKLVEHPQAPESGTDHDGLEIRGPTIPRGAR